jgi:HEAT repeat protein
MTPHDVVVVLLGGSVLAWLSLSLFALVGRAGYEVRLRDVRQRAGPGRVRARTLQRRAARHVTESGRWRRASALVELSRADHPACRRLLEKALASADAGVREAAVRGLGLLGPRHEWALDLLLEVLRDGTVSRSRVATELEHVGAPVFDRIAEALDDESPHARFWAASLLCDHPGLATDRLIELTTDPDASVRAAAAEALGAGGRAEALPAVLRLLSDEEMFVRAHACRAAGDIGGLAVADRITPHLADRAWWVRSAAKDALRTMGPAVLSTLLPVLGSEDRFARNGAAEVLQDVGVVDHLLADGAGSALLERIFVAGGMGLREAATDRARTQDDERGPTSLEAA